jgi:hypothetical protein
MPRAHAAIGRRAGLVLVFVLVFAPHIVAAQVAAARWRAAAGAGIAGFSSLAAHTELAVATRLVPARATVAGVTVSRHAVGWTFEAGLDLLTTAVRVENDAVSVEARGASLSRMRWRMSAGRLLFRIGDAEVTAAAGPALDAWWADGGNVRGRLAGRGRIAARVDAGAFALENSIAASVAGGPLDARELPDGYRGRTLTSVEAAISVSFAL